MEERLRYILSNVNEWLKFAEAKNGALLAVNGAVVLGALRLADGRDFFCRWVEYYFYFAIVMGGLSGIVCLLSFLPQTQIPSLRVNSSPNEKGSLVFYGDLAGCDPSCYVRALHTQGGTELEAVDAFERDLAEQAIVNSRIAIWKYQLFSVALWLDVAGLLTPIGWLILYLVLRRREA